MERRDSVIFGVFLFLAAAVTPVHAYLDPGTGSFVLQMVLGGVAGAILLVKVYWQRLLGFFGPRSASDLSPENARHVRENEGE